MIYEQQVSERDYLLVIGQSWPWGNHVTGKKKLSKILSVWLLKIAF